MGDLSAQFSDSGLFRDATNLEASLEILVQRVQGNLLTMSTSNQQTRFKSHANISSSNIPEVRRSASFSRISFMINLILISIHIFNSTYRGWTASTWWILQWLSEQAAFVGQVENSGSRWIQAKE
jgi:hypothetical protein